MSRPQKQREIRRPEIVMQIKDGEAPTKKQLRYSMLEARDKISYSEVLASAASLREHVRAWTPFRDASCICCYVSIRSEMPTPGIIIRAMEGGKSVIVPRVFNDEIRFFRIKNLTDDLARGTFGVLEPINGCEEVDPRIANVCLIPGVAFDENGNRIGYGKGYYDRFLKRLPATIPTLGMAFDCQVLEKIPFDPTDIPVQFLVTPMRGVFSVK